MSRRFNVGDTRLNFQPYFLGTESYKPDFYQMKESVIPSIAVYNFLFEWSRNYQASIKKQHAIDKHQPFVETKTISP